MVKDGREGGGSVIMHFLCHNFTLILFQPAGMLQMVDKKIIEKIGELVGEGVEEMK
jgi:hypothetical protein